MIRPGVQKGPHSVRPRLLVSHPAYHQHLHRCPEGPTEAGATGGGYHSTAFATAVYKAYEENKAIGRARHHQVFTTDAPAGNGVDPLPRSSRRQSSRVPRPFPFVVK